MLENAPDDLEIKSQLFVTIIIITRPCYVITCVFEQNEYVLFLLREQTNSNGFTTIIITWGEKKKTNKIYTSNELIIIF